MKALAKRFLVAVLPLSVRKRLAIRVNRSTMLSPDTRGYWATELLVDFAQEDPNAYHKFLWTHHLAYARTYEIGLRFGFDNFNESRKLFFGELPARLGAADIQPSAVRSVLDVGCSLGYLLRHAETEVFPAAERLVGIDIDKQAIDDGAGYLSDRGSRIELYNGDIESLAQHVGNEQFDLVMATGVLLYFDQPSALTLVKQLLERTRGMLAIAALAHPAVDNQRLQHSEVRESDGTWVHNVDAMIMDAGGEVVARRWEGGRMIDGNTIYFLYAVPQAGNAAEAV